MSSPAVAATTTATRRSSPSSQQHQQQQQQTPQQQLQHQQQQPQLIAMTTNSATNEFDANNQKTAQQQPKETLRADTGKPVPDEEADELSAESVALLAASTNNGHCNEPPPPEQSPVDDSLTKEWPAMNGGSLRDHSTTTSAGSEPSALSKFEPQAENAEEQAKRARIEAALADPGCNQLAIWQEFATSEYGLINDDLRRQVWPRLVGLDPAEQRLPTPSLEELRHHPEYNQVILDVNRSLKRFPPGIPYEQRIALQDQLTVLILRVILKHPHLRYYQGYHDVAVTFLLVVGDEMAFHVMEHLSTNHLVECMQETMEPTQRRLMFMYPLVRHVRPALCAYVERSGVGTLFALPWFLTWFGHSLNSYRDVVRLYDYFLARAFLLPIYVTAAIVLYREDEIFREDCDMASMHCVLSRLPDDLPFEYILRQADELYERWPPQVVELEVEQMIVEEKAQRKRDEEAAIVRRAQLAERRAAAVARAAAAAAPHSIFDRIIPFALLTRRSVYVTTAVSIFVGIYAYYYKSHLVATGIS